MNLYKHQSTIIKEDKPKTGLFLGTGSGKTRIALSLAREKVLVIAPRTQVEDQNWERELMSIIGLIPNNPHVSDMTVISKETFRRDADKLPRFHTVIVDEAHTCLGVTPNIRWVKKKPVPKTSQLFEVLEKYLARTRPERFYLCTATVIRSPMTVWAAGKLLGKKWDFYEFRQTFYVRLPMPGREVWVPKNDNATKNRLAAGVKKIGYVGRLEDFFDVPDQTFKTIYINLTLEQKQRIKDMKLEYPEPIVRIGKINQIENGILSGNEFSKAEFFPNEKIEKIIDISIEYPRLIVFAKYTAQIAQIAIALQKIDKKVLILTGETKDRGKVIKEANEAKECIFIAQAQISAGWELPEYPCMIFASRTYSFVDYDQALGRIQRANNIKKNLYIHLVVRGGIDEAVHNCLLNKKDFNERLYDKK